jgi:SAM-dependent methyltransferase
MGSELTPVQIWGAEVRRVQTVLDQVLPGGPITALDAGCGSISHLNVPEGSRLVGLDAEREALAAHADTLDEVILADLDRPVALEPRFDLIVCWDVIEHLRHPRVAFETFIRGLKPGGALVLAGPSLLSPKGLLTKATPYRLHVWFYRRFLHRPQAGTPGHNPYPTFMSWEMAPPAIRRYLMERGLRLHYLTGYESPMQATMKQRFAPFRWGWAVLRAILLVLSGTVMDIDKTDFIAVFTRPAGPAGIHT